MNAPPLPPNFDHRLDLPVIIFKEKTIYASRGRSVKTQKEVSAIISLEIENQLIENPDYDFEKIVAVKSNDDLSKTIALGFRLKGTIL